MCIEFDQFACGHLQRRRIPCRNPPSRPGLKDLFNQKACDTWTGIAKVSNKCPHCIANPPKPQISKPQSIDMSYEMSGAIPDDEYTDIRVNSEVGGGHSDPFDLQPLLDNLGDLPPTFRPDPREEREEHPRHPVFDEPLSSNLSHPSAAPAPLSINKRTRPPLTCKNLQRQTAKDSPAPLPPDAQSFMYPTTELLYSGEANPFRHPEPAPLPRGNGINQEYWNKYRHFDDEPSDYSNGDGDPDAVSRMQPEPEEQPKPQSQPEVPGKESEVTLWPEVRFEPPELVKKAKADKKELRSERRRISKANIQHEVDEKLPPKAPSKSESSKPSSEELPRPRTQQASFGKREGRRETERSSRRESRDHEHRRRHRNRDGPGERRHRQRNDRSRDRSQERRHRHRRNHSRHRSGDRHRRHRSRSRSEERRHRHRHDRIRSRDRSREPRHRRRHHLSPPSNSPLNTHESRGRRTSEEERKRKHSPARSERDWRDSSSTRERLKGWWKEYYGEDSRSRREPPNSFATRYPRMMENERRPQSSAGERRPHTSDQANLNSNMPQVSRSTSDASPVANPSPPRPHSTLPASVRPTTASGFKNAAQRSREAALGRSQDADEKDPKGDKFKNALKVLGRDFLGKFKLTQEEESELSFACEKAREIERRKENQQDGR